MQDYGNTHVNTSLLPKDLVSYPYWTRHQNKRPLVDNGDFSNAKPFHSKQIAPYLFEQNGVGALLHPQEKLAIIDIDFHGSKQEKEAFIATIQTPQEEWSTEKYTEWVKQTSTLFSQLENTSLQSLIYETYTEWSPSGIGLHVFVHLTDKNTTKAAYIKSTNKQYKGQISLQNAFVTVTGRYLANAPNEIKTISLQELNDVFAIRATAAQPPQHQNQATQIDFSNINQISIEQVIDALNVVPPQPLLKTQEQWYQLTNRTYEHYDFWLTIGMALHNWGLTTKQLPTAYGFWSQWSQQDKQNYTNEEDLERKWESFNIGSQSHEIQVTINTLLALAAKLQFTYPRPLTKDKKILSSFPQIKEYANFKYLMDFYSIELWEDDLYYVSGNDEIMQKYFNNETPPLLNKFYGPYTQKELESFTWQLCQDSNWRQLSGVANFVQTWVVAHSKRLDLFKEWLHTPFNELPEPMKQARFINKVFNVEQYNNQSTVEHLFKCLNIKWHSEDERQLYFSLVKKTLFQIIKFREPQHLFESTMDNGGMLILTGPQNTFKSTFLKLLLPAALQGLRKEVVMQGVASGKELRDFVRQLCKKVIIQIDEFEGFMNLATHSSQFKTLLSANEMAITEIYEKSERQTYRTATIVGSTNKTTLILTDDGTRRMWFIPVGKIDTENAAKVNLHKLYNDLYKEFHEQFNQGILPWLLTQKEVELLEKLNSQYCSTTDLDIILEEFWPAEGTIIPDEYLKGLNIKTYKGPKLMKTLEIIAFMKMHNYEFKGKLVALEHALHKHCGAWTESITQDVWRNTAVIIKGELCQNQRAAGNGYHYKKWVMPPVNKIYS